MTIDKFSEFSQIRIDQGLNLVLESHAILCGMPSNSSVVLTFSINIISFHIRKSSWSYGNDRNPMVLDQYGEQFSIGHRKCVVHFGPFPFLALVIAWVRLLIIFLCEPLGRMKTGQGDLGIPWWTRMILDRLFLCRMWSSFAPFFLSRHCLNMLIENDSFFLPYACPSVYNSSSLYSIFDSPHRIH